VGFGAVGENGVLVLDGEVIQSARITEVERAVTERHERVIMDGQARLFRGGREPMDLRGRTVIVVDDGIAMGTTARAGCEMVRAAGASSVVLAVPVAAPEGIRRNVDRVDELVALVRPVDLGGVGRFYEDFSQVPDAVVVNLLDVARQRCEATQTAET